MKRLRTLFASLLCIFLFSASSAYAFTVFLSGQVGSTPAKGYVLQTDGTNSTWVATSTLGISGGSSGVSSFNTRTGAVTLSSSDVTSALGFTPASFAYPFPGNATSTALTFSGGASLSSLTLSGITGSTQCLHVDSSGNVGGTGSDCGSGGTSYSFTSGLTNTGGTVTNDLSTGVSGGQSVVGGTGAGESLTLVSTQSSTKGLIYFGAAQNAFYDTANQYFQINTNGAGTTQTLTSGTWYQNSTAAASGAQQISPSVVWEGQGWKTTATAGSEPVRFQSYVLPVQGTTAPSGNWLLQSSINGAAFASDLTVTSAGAVTANSFSTSASTNSDFYASSPTSATHSVVAQYQLGATVGTGFRTAFYGTASTVLTANDSYAGVLVANAPVTEGTSGNHAILANLAVKPIGAITSGVATVSNTAAVYIDGAASATVTGNNWELYASSTAPNFFGGGLSIATTSTTGALNLGGDLVSSGNVYLQALGTPAGTFLAVDPTGHVIATTTPSGALTSVSNADSTLTISPTTGAVVASLNLAHANTWTGLQTFNAGATSTSLSVTNAGLAGAPSLVIGTGNAGLFQSGTNQLGLAAGGTQITWSGTEFYPILSNAKSLGKATNVWSNVFTTNASTTNLTIGTLSGILKATAGAVSTALVNLTSDVTGILPILNGGTNASSETTNGVAYFDGTKITTGTNVTYNGSEFAVLASQPATSTSMTLSWSATPNQVEYQIGTAATTIFLTNATTSTMWGSRKMVTVCNPTTTAGAVTWVGVEWAGGATPTQTTTGSQCDVYSFWVTHATSTAAYKVFGAMSAGYQ